MTLLDRPNESGLMSNDTLVAQIALYAESGQVRQLAQEAGVSERTIYRHLNGPTTRVRAGNATAIIEALEQLQAQRRA